MKKGRLVAITGGAIGAIVLAVLLFFPAVPHHPGPNTMSAARRDVQSVTAAVKGYYTEYGYYPLGKTSLSRDVTFSANNHRLLDILRNVPNVREQPTSDENPRGIVFIEVPPAKKSRSGVLPDGTFVDPWGTPYNIRIDANYDETVDNPIGSEAGSETIRAGVIAWSWGSDGAPGRSQKISTADIGSWF